MSATITTAVENLIAKIEREAEELGIVDEVLDNYNLYNMSERQEALDLIKTTRYNQTTTATKQEDKQVLIVDVQTKESVHIDAIDLPEFTTVAAAKSKAKKSTKQTEPTPVSMTKLNTLLDKRAALAKQLEELDAEIAVESETLRKQQTQAEAQSAPKVHVNVTPEPEPEPKATKTKATKTTKAKKEKVVNPKTKHTTKVIRATAKDKGIDVSTFNFKSSIERAKAALLVGLEG